jgi:hypothetical protein
VRAPMNKMKRKELYDTLGRNVFVSLQAKF